MKLLLKILSVLATWAVVIYIIMYVDPETIKDVGMVGAYLPFTVAVVFAVWYTTMMVYRSLILSLVTGALVALAIVLSIMQLMNIFTGIVILLLIGFSIFLFKRQDLIIESKKSAE